MTDISINRAYLDDCTIGVLECQGTGFRCFALSLPDKNNMPNVSCIPCGVYEYEIGESPRNGKVIKILSVPNRTHIQIHAGNFTYQIAGCILVGDSIRFLDDDRTPDVANSKNTLKKLLEFVPKRAKLKSTIQVQNEIFNAYFYFYTERLSDDDRNIRDCKRYKRH